MNDERIGTELTLLGWTNVLDASKLSAEDKDDLEKAGYDIDDDYIWVDAVTFDRLRLPCESVVDTCQDEDVDDLLRDYLPDGRQWLVFASGCTWDGRSGYKITESPFRTIDRGYEVTIVVRKYSKDGNALLCTESSHDVPMGSCTYIISVDNETRNLIENEWSFADVKKFVNSFEF